MRGKSGVRSQKRVALKNRKTSRRKWGHDTNSAMPENLFRVPKTSRTGQTVAVALIALILLAVVSTAAWAVPEPRKIDTGNVTKFEEPAEAGAEGGHEKPAEEGHEGKVEESKPDSLSEGKGIREGEAEEQGHEGEEEHVPVWMIPGWQTIFALLAVGYYAFMVTYLPKIMAKEEGHH